MTCPICSTDGVMQCPRPGHVPMGMWRVYEIKVEFMSGLEFHEWLGMQEDR